MGSCLKDDGEGWSRASTNVLDLSEAHQLNIPPPQSRPDRRRGEHRELPLPPCPIADPTRETRVGVSRMDHQLGDSGLESVQQDEQPCEEITPAGEGKASEVVGVTWQRRAACRPPPRRGEEQLPRCRERPP